MEIPLKIKMLRVLSKGNFGEVYLCENTYLAGRNEAVKVIKRKGEEIKINEDLFEPSVLEYLKKSKYIVEIYNADITNDALTINMEYLKDGSVQQLLDKNNFLSSKTILKISECVLNALEYAHNKGIFHLDIKPGNILIKNENIYKLSDFGLANTKDQDGNSSFKKIYTIHTPPEKIANPSSKATEQSDIYMFGVTLYRLLNGDAHLKKQIESLKSRKELNDLIVSGKFPDLKKQLPHVDKRLKKIAERCLSIDLSKRYKNIREIKNNLGKIKIKYSWIAKNISDKLHCWDCFLNENLYLELIAEKKSSNLWTVTLMKYGKKKKMKVKKYCNKNIKSENVSKKISEIFSEYI
ncbi:MAG: serine/threonine-protein kinase [Minisyncoccales bacterium]